MTPALVLMRVLREVGATFDLNGNEVELEATTDVVEERLSELRRCRGHIRMLLMVEAKRPCGCELIDGSVSAIELRRHLGWSDTRFSSFSEQVIKRPGPASVADDEAILNAMLHHVCPI